LICCARPPVGHKIRFRAGAGTVVSFKGWFCRHVGCIVQWRVGRMQSSACIHALPPEALRSWSPSSFARAASARARSDHDVFGPGSHMHSTRQHKATRQRSTQPSAHDTQAKHDNNASNPAQPTGHGDPPAGSSPARWVTNLVLLRGPGGSQKPGCTAGPVAPPMPVHRAGGAADASALSPAPPPPGRHAGEPRLLRPAASGPESDQGASGCHPRCVSCGGLRLCPQAPMSCPNASL